MAETQGYTPKMATAERLVRGVVLVALLVTTVFVVQLALGKDVSWLGTGDALWHGFWRAVGSRTFWTQAIFVFFLFIANFLIFLGPLLLMGISQIRGYEPGDAQWGVRLEDVRGQAEAKEEVRRVVSLWQSGEAFESAGGRRERGLLFVGAPGTGKTMLAKAIATGFNSPFVSIPGSGFAQAFIGIDAIIVRWLARKARRLAAKWGGQCIVFIDQIVESRAWREHLFELRAPESRSPYPPWARKLGNILNQGLFPGMMGGGGQLALNQLLVTMDGIDNPPYLRRVLTSTVNS